MKKKLLACLIAVVMVFGLVAPALAETTTTTTTETTEGSDGTTVTVTTTVTISTKEDAAAKEAPAEPAEPEEIVVLYTNDVHCGVSDNIGYTGLALLKNALKAAGKNVLLVDNGDAVQGGTIGTLSKGEYIIDIMNAVGYDVAAIGNHEFDYGMEQFMKNVERANFPYVCANFTDAAGKPIFDAYKIFEIGGKKVAFIGVATPKTFTSSTPAYFQDENGNYIYTFSEDETGKKLYDTVQNAVNDARAAGADYVIALTHLGIEEDCSPWTSSEVITNTSGIDVFLDAHSHSVLPKEIVKNKDGNDVILTSTGTKLNYVGCLTITPDGKLDTMLLNNSTVEYGKLLGALNDDGGVAEKIVAINAEFDALVNKVVANTKVDLVTQDPTNKDIRIVRSQETNLGDLCADAYRTLSGADIAFVNGGGIRKDISAGDITFGQIIAVHPFGNAMCVVEATGAEILDALELSVSKLPGEFGGFEQVSGLKFYIDLNVDSTVVCNDKGDFIEVSGDRRVKGVTVLNRETGAYEPIDPEKTYTFASHNYMIKGGGDGYTMFKDNNLLQDEVMIDNQVLINYIVETLGGTVGEAYQDPFGEGRITIIEKGQELPAELAPAAEPEAADQPAGLLGGWTIYDGETAALPEEVQTAFDSASKELLGNKLVPVAYLGSQVVAGTNDAILCKSTPVTLNPETKLVVVILYRDLEGNAKITHISDFALTASEEEATPAEQLAGGWAIPQEYAVITLPDDPAAAFAKAKEGFVGNSLEPIAYLGSQVVAGTNYAILCHSTLATNPPVSSIQLVIVTVDPEGNATFGDIRTLNIADYNTDAAAETEAPGTGA